MESPVLVYNSNQCLQTWALWFLLFLFLPPFSSLFHLTLGFKRNASDSEDGQGIYLHSILGALSPEGSSSTTPAYVWTSVLCYDHTPICVPPIRL